MKPGSPVVLTCLVKNGHFQAMKNTVYLKRRKRHRQNCQVTQRRGSNMSLLSFLKLGSESKRCLNTKSLKHITFYYFITYITNYVKLADGDYLGVKVIIFII